MLCMRVLIRPRAHEGRARAHISVSVFVALSRERFFDFPETSLLPNFTFYPHTTLALTHTQKERETERTSLVYNLRGRAYLVFSSFCLFLGKRVCVQITVER